MLDQFHNLYYLRFGGYVVQLSSNLKPWRMYTYKYGWCIHLAVLAYKEER